MTSSWLLWLAAAVLLFWSVGAYNRLVRLRAAANTAFAVLQDRLQQQVALVRSLLAAADPRSRAEDRVNADALVWSGLEGAAAQLAASLVAARVRPLEPERIAALDAARNVLVVAWARVEREDTHDLAGPRLPAEALARQGELLLHGQGAITQFNQQVQAYNEAIAQFPALLLAWLFDFKPARGL